MSGPLQDPTITLLDGPKKFFGVTNWGFTPQNELFAGRLAALGIAAAIVGELVTGLGPVGQLSAGERGEVVIPGMLLVSVSPACLLMVAVMLAVDSMHNSSFQLTAAGASLTISCFTLWLPVCCLAACAVTALERQRLLVHDAEFIWHKRSASDKASAYACLLCRDWYLQPEHILRPCCVGLLHGLHCRGQAGS